MNNRVVGVIFAIMLTWPLPAWSHTQKHSDSVAGPHGGQSRLAGPYHLELVVKDGELLLYVTDHADKAIFANGARAKATIQQGYEKAGIQVELEPSGENMLKGTGAFTISPDAGIIVFIKLPEQEAYSTRFGPTGPNAAQAKKNRK